MAALGSARGFHEPLRKTIDNVARLADLAELDRNIRAESAPDQLAQGFRAVDDEELVAHGIQVALDQVVEKGLPSSTVKRLSD